MTIDAQFPAAPAPQAHWSQGKRAGHSLHEVPYRACFKPELPRHFIERYTQPGDVVYDPFMGRGTTPLEAWLSGRIPLGNDANPLSRVLVSPRIQPPGLEEVAARLASLDLSAKTDIRRDLLVFYHRRTLQQIHWLRDYLMRREQEGTLDKVDAWIRMVVLTRLTGHSSGFLSVYTLPPNQAVSLAAQTRLNERRGLVPPFRDLRAIVLSKSRSLLRDPIPQTALGDTPSPHPKWFSSEAAKTPGIAARSVNLIVTSPPFLDIVRYPNDQWLRMWFCGFDPTRIPWLMEGDIEEWKTQILRCFLEFDRILAVGGRVVVEVGEVRKGTVDLARSIEEMGLLVAWQVEQRVVQTARFTKTAHCWGISNGSGGTNTNRVIVFRRPI